MIAQSILIMENGLLDRRIISEVLQEEGFHARFASDAETGLKVLLQVRPFLILIGLRMPKLDSYTFTRILKNDKDTSNITIIALSEANSDHEKLTNCGFDSIINMEEGRFTFFEKVKKLIKKQATAF